MPEIYARSCGANSARLGRCYLKRTAGDAANTILTAVGYNRRLVLAWLRMLLRVILPALRGAFPTPRLSWRLNG